MVVWLRRLIRRADLLTSRNLADVVGDALGITRASAQLHLKTIRVDGQISFKGYGRGAADMTSLDAARLVISVAGSTFAKDSAQVLERFAGLTPVGTKRSQIKLEDFLSERIAELPMPVMPELRDRSVGRSFGSRRLAQTALQLYEPIGEKVDKAPRYAVVRWLEREGHSKRRIFGSAGHWRNPTRKGVEEDESDTGAAEFHDILGQYPIHQLFQVRAVGRQALITIAAALKGVPIT